MQQTEAWLDHLRTMNRKENTLITHLYNVRRCLMFLHADGRSTDARDIVVEDIQYLWRTLPLKEDVRRAYLRSLSAMVEFHTGQDIVKRTDILHNRESRERVFIRDEDFLKAYRVADPFQKVILCLGAYMGLRRGEMQAVRDSDIDCGVMMVHGKGHGEDGLVAYLDVPPSVAAAIREYRESEMKQGERTDDYLLQTRARDGSLHQADVSRISMAVQALGIAAGVRITTHSLRRYYATTLYYSTDCDLQTVRKLMRHADVSTTLKCYVDAYDEQAMEASEKLVEHIDALVGERKE